MLGPGCGRMSKSVVVASLVVGNLSISEDVEAAAVGSVSSVGSDGAGELRAEEDVVCPFVRLSARAWGTGSGFELCRGVLIEISVTVF